MYNSTNKLPKQIDNYMNLHTISNRSYKRNRSDRTEIKIKILNTMNLNMCL